MGSGITYQFKKHGYQVSGDVGDNSLFVDIGNDLKKGIIDHHQIRDKIEKKDKGSTVKAFDAEYARHLIGNTNSVVIYTHTQPDCDAILSTYMASVLINKGEETFAQIFGKNQYGYKLIEYVDKIDSGYGKKVIPNSDKASFYVAICFLDKIACALSFLRDNDSLDDFDYKVFTEDLDQKGRTECDQFILEVGHKLVEVILNKLEENSELKISDYPIEWASFIDNEKVRTYISSLYKNDHDKYLEEKKNSINFEDICVWGRNERVYDRKLKAAIWREVPVSEFSYLYARQEDDAVVTVIPRCIKEKNEACKLYTHVTISIDPEKDISRDISLKPLAEALELMEQIEENAYYSANGLWRRDHSRCRNGFETAPFVATADPWFYTEDEMLVEDPGKHSLIEYESIISLIERHTNLIETVNSKEYRNGHLSNIIENGKMTISRWISRVGELVADHSNDSSYDIIVTEVDAVMIKSRNDVLRALCMSVLGNNVFETKDILELDYYSSIYADENFVLTIMANEGGETNTNGRRLFSLVDDVKTDSIKKLTEKIAGISKKVVNQRNTLIEIGEGIDKCVGEPANSRKMYRKYVEYIALEQKNGVIRNLTEQEIYDYLRRMLKIGEMKETIQDAVDIVTTDSKERIYSIFNFLTAVTVPFVIISTFFQMGMIQLAPFITDDGVAWPVLWKWLVVIAVAVLSCVAVFKKGKK